MKANLMSQQNLSEKIFSLPVQEQITPYISQRQIDELPVVVVNHPKVRAAVTLQGAHLLTWQPSGEKPVLWLSSESAFKNGVAISRRYSNLLAVVWPCRTTCARFRS
jgi:glucose-6-phosphate 1-epimerase